MHNTTSPRPVTDETIEQELRSKGLVANRVTPVDLDREIVAEDYYTFPGTTVTICCLTLRNGFHTIGESACADPANFDAGVGARLAREQARQKLWPLLGYALKDRLHGMKNRLAADAG